MISIILPFFNEVHWAEEALRSVREYCSTAFLDYEIIAVDDGSTDDTLVTLNKYAEGKENVCVVSNDKNRGKGYSIKRGMTLAKGEYWVLMDGDMTYLPEQISALVEKLESGFDVVIGSRRLRGSRFRLGVQSFPYIYFRHLQGLVFNFYVRLMTGLELSDTQCGFKAVSRSFGKVVIEKTSVEGFSFDVEMLVIASHQGAKMAEIPVILNYYDENDTKLGMRNTIDAVLDVSRICLKHRS